MLKHGNAIRAGKTPTYLTWLSMWSRCTNPNVKSYRLYGGAGIQVCPQWASFEKFLEDVGERPSRDYSLDRIKGELGYQPGNVRWATKREQARNRCNLRPITAFGETLLMEDWVRRTGLPKMTLVNRLNKGWEPERAISTPSRPMRRAA